MQGADQDQPDPRGFLPIDYEVILESDTVNEAGNRVMEFTMVSGFPLETYPSVKDGIYTRWHTFYDYDTGLTLANDDSFADNTSMNIQFQHPSGQVDLVITESKQRGDVYEMWGDDWKLINTTDITIEMPQWYHGLVLGALTLPEYSEDVTYEHMEDITESDIYEFVEAGMRMRID